MDRRALVKRRERDVEPRAHCMARDRLLSDRPDRHRSTSEMEISRRMALGFIAGALVCAPAAAAQTFPNRVIKIVSPLPPGGPGDAIPRLVADRLGKSFGYTAIVENVVGASGAIGARQVARADPDGHTIILGNAQSHVSNMLLLKDPGYGAMKDFALIAGVGAFEHVFVVPSASPVRTMKDLVELARKEP